MHEEKERGRERERERESARACAMMREEQGTQTEVGSHIHQVCCCSVVAV